MQRNCVQDYRQSTLFLKLSEQEQGKERCIPRAHCPLASQANGLLQHFDQPRRHQFAVLLTSPQRRLGQMIDGSVQLRDQGVEIELTSFGYIDRVAIHAGPPCA